VLLQRSAPKLVVFAAIVLCGGPESSLAQGAATVAVRVSLADATTGAPIADADVSIVRGLRTVIAQEVTDAAGLRVLSVKNDSGDYQVVVRKIGYRRADRFFPTGSHDTVVVDIPMTQIAQTLGAVKITAKEDLARKSYYIDDEEISNNTLPLFTAVDIVEKLRPDMIWGRSGPGVCGKISSVFVNGRRIMDASDAARQAAAARIPNTSAILYGANTVNPAALANAAKLTKYKVTGLPAAILSSIKPEHIAEMTYNDCFEKSAKVDRGANALFIILKPGVGYSLEDGSYVVEPATPRSP
jgi:hypothetical protein